MMTITFDMIGWHCGRTSELAQHRPLPFFSRCVRVSVLWAPASEPVPPVWECTVGVGDLQKGREAGPYMLLGRQGLCLDPWCHVHPVHVVCLNVVFLSGEVHLVIRVRQGAKCATFEMCLRWLGYVWCECRTYPKRQLTFQKRKFYQKLPFHVSNMNHQTLLQ